MRRAVLCLLAAAASAWASDRPFGDAAALLAQARAAAPASGLLAERLQALWTAPEAPCYHQQRRGAATVVYETLIDPLDALEESLLGRLAASEGPRLFVSARFARPRTLYRGVGPAELKAVIRDGWSYRDPGDERRYRFATPRLEAARRYASRFAFGAVLEIRAPQTVPLFWEGDEHLILLTGKEEARLVEVLPCPDPSHRR
ncbi:MAG: hypothetical protein HY554_17935 [Elusimicrobia bacterium]|nr:hypothetical protein [Elusimicrobiota bacterium]